MIRLLLIAITCLTLTFPAYAQVVAETESCDFLINFPDEPVINTQCDSPDECTTAISYTNVHIGEATVKVNALCKPSSDEDYNRFSEEEMTATLMEQAKISGIKQYQTHSATIDNTAKYAVLTGAKTTSESTNIYMNQLWISNTSILSVEGEITGVSSDDIDQEFSRILRSVRPKNITP